MAPKEPDSAPQEIFVKVDVSKLPSFSALNKKVQSVVKSSTWWQLYGIDWLQIFLVTSFVPAAFLMLREGGIFNYILATFILGSFHSIISNKGGHIVTHGGLCQSKALTSFLNVFLLEFIGSYSSFMATYTHVDIHHPYTNIIGLGDSSSWKVPFLSRELYLFFAPLFLPLITPFVAILQLIQERKFPELCKFVPVLVAGLVCHFFLLSHYAGFTLLGAIVYTFTYRAVFSVPYIHVNIFQHIGLPMYSPKSRPTRIYQMSTGVLNLPRNPVLDIVFGHSLVSCHVEHHLFPRLSDNMCLKIKPIVKAYLQDHGLAYHEDTYWNRLVDFYNRYEELMVHAPPITHFVGIQ